MDDVLIFEAHGTVAHLPLNRPKAMNSLNLAILAQLEQRLVQIAADDTLRAVILTGSGAAFCADVDLKEVLAGANAQDRTPEQKALPDKR